MDPDGFETSLAGLLDTTGFGLSSDLGVVDAFGAVLKKASGLSEIEDTKQRAAVLEQRRCLLLAIIGSTTSSNKALEKIVDNGYLSSVKTWLDDALANRVGGIDLLLHLLSNIVDLPVNKATVKESGMGKAIGTIEKHSICKGTPNESAISDRVSSIKDAWQASVKARKSQAGAASSSTVASASGSKREAAAESSSPTATKRAKATTPGAPSSSFSSLIKRVSSSSSTSAAKKIDTSGAKASSPSRSSSNSDSAGKKKSSSSNRVKWADHFGGELEAARFIEGEEIVASETPVSTPNSVSWTDRKKRDRAREKELLASVKKVKLLDDEDDDQAAPPAPSPPSFSATIKTNMSWVLPAPLPLRTDVSKPVLNSPESSAQTERARIVTPVQYLTDLDVPSNPAPLSDVEQALDMTSQSSAVVESIPFFVPQQPEPTPSPAPSPVAAPAPAASFYGSDNSVLLGTQPQSASSVGATPELLQALGLPMFLVGQDVQALQTLASSPGLLSNMLDSSGMYDQNRVLSLVRTLSGTSAHTDSSSMYNSAQSGPYGSSSHSPYNSSPPFVGGSSGGGGPRSKSDEGNLHLAGYGPGTTQADIITLFLPYVKVDEVVMKGTFAFVNTSDPPGAQRAKESLQGALLNGTPVRINPAQRKARDSSSFAQPSTSAYGPSAGTPTHNVSQATGMTSNMPFHGGPPPQRQPPTQPPPPPPPAGGPGPGIYPNVEHVRDDRGNPATKNLFVAGYGQGTNEQQIRDTFNQHCQVVGVVLKGNFTFVNTAHKAEAVKAREMLQGQSINGGVLRINFAKETGRLGTSFDLTYNERSGPNAGRGAGPPGRGPDPHSYYGRGH